MVESGGAVLAHSVFCLAPVSRSHIETSLLPCTADITHDCSNGCVTRRRTLAPVKENIFCTCIQFSICMYKVLMSSIVFQGPVVQKSNINVIPNIMLSPTNIMLNLYVGGDLTLMLGITLMLDF